MTGDVIKSFLVGLGFDVDDSSLAKFNKSIESAAIRVTALYASINVASTAIVAGITDISEGFEKLGYEYRIISPIINKTLMLRQELLKAYSAAGINITKVVQESVKLNMSITKTKFALEAIYKSVGSRFFTLLTKQSELFRMNIYKNMPKIQAALEKFIFVIFRAFEAVTELGIRLWSILTRVYDFFVRLDKATDGWSTIILGVVAAWKLLNLSFLATPLGLLIAGLTTLLALFDDYQTFKEGGQSLFDWSSLVPVLTQVGIIFDRLLDTVLALFKALTAILHLDFGGFIGALKGVLDALFGISDSIDKIFRLFGGENVNKILDLRDSADKSIKDFFTGNPNVSQNIQNNPVGSGVLANPVGSNVQTSNTSQSVQQATTININGTSDAQSVGKAVGGEQSKVNFDLVRNLRGATR